MNTLLRIMNISESTAEELAGEFNRLIPGFCKDIGKHLLVSDLYSFFLSDDENWLSHQDEIIDVLSKLGNSLLQVSHSGAKWSVNPCLHMTDYGGAFVIDYDFTNDLLQIIAKFGGYLEVSFYPSCWTCAHVFELPGAKNAESESENSLD